MNCLHCGASLREGATVCDNCGQAVVSATQQYQTPTNQQSNQQPNQQYQYGYQQPGSYNQNYNQNYNQAMGDSSVMSVGSWIITFIIFAIPFVGIVMMFIWAFGSSGNLNRRNYARASLLISLVMLILGIIFAIVWGALFASIFSNIEYYSEFADIIESMNVANLLSFFR